MKCARASVVVALLAYYCGAAAVAAAVVGVVGADNDGSNKDTTNNFEEQETSGRRRRTQGDGKPPNVLIFVVDDLGWNQVGYHANPDNMEIRTPNIDQYATTAGVGIPLERGYMTPWCGPSRAALQTGRSNSYNANVSNNVWAFDEDIGFVGGLPTTGTDTLATAFKRLDPTYKTYYNGKWGIGGGAFANTPMGLGYDKTLAFLGDTIESCDGYYNLWPFVVEFAGPFQGYKFFNTLPAYWEQGTHLEDNEWCAEFQGLDILTDEEKAVACKTQPRSIQDKEQLIDLDLLADVENNILTHNYDDGPFFQVFATQLMHTPLNYPKSFNEQDDSLPNHFKDGQEKPIADADDQRLATAKCIEFVDDVFGKTMQAIEDAGQWNNTVVYFTSDNGGAIYTGTVNNNWPLRGQKFSKFEGGIRVPQFLTGGYLNDTLITDPWMTTPSGNTAPSETFVFAMDIGPTLLQMAGGDKTLLLDSNDGPVYGNEMFDFIANSVTGQAPVQMTRKASYAIDFWFDVVDDSTIFKSIYFNNTPVYSPRHWNSTWPKNGDLLMDYGYYSVRPCRPDGEPSPCCLLNVYDDPHEYNPLSTNCDALLLDGQNLYTIEGGCEEVDDNGVFENPMCLDRSFSRQTNIHGPRELALWTQYGAAGPFLNTLGENVPADMKCVCQVTSDEGKDFDFFTLTAYSPTECFSANLIDLDPLLASVKCDGSLTYDNPETDILEAYVKEGIDEADWTRATLADQQQSTKRNSVYLLKATLDYANRVGFTEWPNIAKFPFIAGGLDTCPQKDVTLVPTPPVSITPYTYGFFTPVDVAESLCVLLRAPAFGWRPSWQIPLLSTIVEWVIVLIDFVWSFIFGPQTRAWCPSKQSPLLEPIEQWVIDFNDVGNTHAIFENGTKWYGMSEGECARLCTGDAEGTAYIGGETDPFGMKV